MEGLEQILERARHAEEAYGELLDKTLPSTLKQAVDEGLVVASDSVSAVIAYGGDEDRKRLIPLPSALRIMEELEEEMIDKMVKDPLTIMRDKARGIALFAKTIISGLPLVWRIVLSEVDDLDTFLQQGPIERWADISRAIIAVAQAVVEISRRALQAIYLLAATSIGLAAFSQLAARSKTALETAVQKMKKRALPSNEGKRYIRRKVATL